MKCFQRIYLAILLCGLLGGCSKEPTPQLLIGEWLWEGSSGGFGGAIIKPAPGERIIMKFTDDSQFSIYQNDTLAYSGTVRIGQAHSIYSGKEEPRIEFEKIKAGSQAKNARYFLSGGIIMSLSTTQLSIGDNVYDGYGSSFVRNQ
ncbi:hypothetical protein GO730_19660 [Spirosoma sp. HMF3257]|uniref:Lipoprotein n=1 Tax=Spirosoma telluris TaxID=2183553 RepID=A0A327NLY4_9BACT|nr:hypothetical protein [Spirosoma telluris]RAI75813.1 hypothetical protein HMF3257_19590 [Spirosoma telluris]